jgi:hypothetical protein
MSNWTGQFSKEEEQMASKYMKKCKSKWHWDSTSYQSGRPSSVTQTTTNAGEDLGKKEPFYTVPWVISSTKLKKKKKKTLSDFLLFFLLIERVQWTHVEQIKIIYF